jgi:hypothetical protein
MIGQKLKKPVFLYNSIETREFPRGLRGLCGSLKDKIQTICTCNIEKKVGKCPKTPNNRDKKATLC